MKCICTRARAVHPVWQDQLLRWFRQPQPRQPQPPSRRRLLRQRRLRLLHPQLPQRRHLLRHQLRRQRGLLLPTLAPVPVRPGAR